MSNCRAALEPLAVVAGAPHPTAPLHTYEIHVRPDPITVGSGLGSRVNLDENGTQPSWSRDARAGTGGGSGDRVGRRSVVRAETGPSMDDARGGGPRARRTCPSLAGRATTLDPLRFSRQFSLGTALANSVPRRVLGRVLASTSTSLTAPW